MSARYQVSIASAGGPLRAERQQMVKSVVALGHLPVDLTDAGIMEPESADTVGRHIGRSDYLVLLIERGDAGGTESLERAVFALEAAGNAGVPVLGIGVGDTTSGAVPDAETAELPLLESLVEKIRSSSRSMFVSFDEVAESAVWVIVKLIDTHPRPGMVPTSELPSGDVASELVRLTKENAELKEELHIGSLESEDSARRSEVKMALQENRILIPIWERAGSTWEKPVEMSLYDFFIRLATELVVETSVSDAAEFIPTGVCELDPGEHVRFVVPHRSLNLWLTDLMSLGLVTPSNRRHAAKDHGHYWTLTEMGRHFFAEVRRSVLETGGHRHVGFTSEFPIVTPGGQAPLR